MRFEEKDIGSLLFSIRQHFGLHAKNARAENPLVNNGIQPNVETAFVLECSSFGLSKLWSQIQTYIAEADTDLIPVPGQLELHGRCRYGVLLSPCSGAL